MGDRRHQREIKKYFEKMKTQTLLMKIREGAKAIVWGKFTVIKATLRKKTLKYITRFYSSRN